MLTWDDTYLKAKQIKAGNAAQELEVELLATYISETFQATVINADIYHEPVITRLPTKLRIIFEGTTLHHLLPVRYEDQKRLIGDVFIDIIASNQIDKYPDLEKGKLDVEYLLYESLRFDEAMRKVSFLALKNGDADIVDATKLLRSIFVFYQNREVLQQKILKQQDKILLAFVMELLKKENVAEVYFNELSVHLDEIGAIDRAGGWYYYFR